MRHLPFFAALPILLLVSGCGDGQNAPETWTERVGVEKLDLAIGLYEDGSAFTAWNEGLYHRSTSWGKMGDEEGAHTRLILRIRADNHSTELLEIARLEATLHFDQEENYIIKGSYDSKLPFTLEILGSAEKEEDNIVLNFAAGEGEIKQTGSILYTYERPNPGQTNPSP